MQSACPCPKQTPNHTPNHNLNHTPNHNRMMWIWHIWNRKEREKWQN